MPVVSHSRYCSRCKGELSKDDYCLAHGWCKSCNDTVAVTCCKVPYWVLAVTLALLWKVHLGL